ncbi:fibronectin type III domain-containing protein [Candidatus Gottesmanbacteria bacterium]|nr:fibronectin type III domain-containing protein [Candidatus Gottesmanbacteria bacterium]
MEPFLTRRSTITIFIILFLTFILALSVSLVERERQDIRQRAQVEDVTLELTPGTVEVPTDTPFSMNVLLNSPTQGVSQVDLVVNYDPTLVHAVNITPGVFLPTMSGSSITETDIGTILATFTTDGVTQTADYETLATITFESLDTPGKNEVTINTSSTVTVTSGVVTPQVSNATVVVMSVPSPSASPSEEPTPPPTPTPSPTPSPSPTPDPTPTPSSTPSATPGTGGSDPTASPFVACTKSAPSSPTNLRAVATGVKTVNLSWSGTANTTHYGIVYGQESGRYTWGAADVGNVTSFTVGNLLPSTRYYFAVFAVNDCASSGVSDEANAKTNASSGQTATPLPDPSPTGGRGVFVPLDPDEEPIPFLTGRRNRLLASPLPQVSVPPRETGEKGGTNVSPLGIFFLFLATLFLGIFLYRIHRGD